jgi:hypothetical protein
MPMVLSGGILMERANTAAEMMDHTTAQFGLYIITVCIMLIMNVLIELNLIKFNDAADYRRFNNLNDFLTAFNISMYILFDYQLDILVHHTTWSFFFRKLFLFVCITFAAEWLSHILKSIKKEP